MVKAVRMCILIEFWQIWSFCYTAMVAKHGEFNWKPNPTRGKRWFYISLCVCVCVCVCVHNAYIILVCNTTYCMLADGNDLLQRPDMLDLLNSFINYYLKHLSWNSRYCATSLMAAALLHTLPVLSPRMRLQCILITLSSVTCISLVRESAVRLNTEDFPCGNIHKGEKAWKVS